MASNVLITTAGTNQIISAGGGNSNGPYFPIKYFLLVYDPKIDSAIHTANLGKITDVLSLTATASVSDTEAVISGGHYIFNIPSAYQITTNQYLLSGGTAQGYQGPNVISGSSYSALSEMNTYLGSACVPCFSGATNLSISGIDYGKWYLTNAASYAKTPSTAVIAGSSFLTDRTKYFQVANFSPISSTTSTTLKGLFKCRVGNNVGNFKFNKIALYATSYNSISPYNENATQPTLVAMAALRDTVYKTMDGNNIANVEIDVECQFSVTNSMSSLVYMTNDYWNRINGNGRIGTGAISGVGLYYNGDVAIGTSGDSGWLPHAKLELTDHDKAQMRLNNTYASHYVDFTVGTDSSMAFTVPFANTTSKKFFSTDGDVFTGERIETVGDVLHSATYGSVINVSSAPLDEYDDILTGQKINIDSKNSGNIVAGSDITVFNRGGYATKIYGQKITLSGDTYMANESAALYSTIGDGVIGATVYNAKFDKGTVLFNDVINLKNENTYINNTGAAVNFKSSLPLFVGNDSFNFNAFSTGYNINAGDLTWIAGNAAYLKFFVPEGNISVHELLYEPSLVLNVSAGNYVSLDSTKNNMITKFAGTPTYQNTSVVGYNSGTSTITALKAGMYELSVKGTINHAALTPTYFTSSATITVTDYAISDDGQYQILYAYDSVASYGGLYISNDFGKSWKFNFSFGLIYAPSIPKVSISSDGRFMMCSEILGGLYQSSDYGITFTLAATMTFPNAISMSKDGKYRVVGRSANISYSSNFGSTWSTTAVVGFGPDSIAISDNGQYITAIDYDAYMIYSTNSGASFATLTVPGALHWKSIAMSRDGKYQTSVVNTAKKWVSNNYGATWTERGDNSSWYDVAMSADGKYQVAISHTSAVDYSSDYGVTWATLDTVGVDLGNTVTMSNDGKTIGYSGDKVAYFTSNRSIINFSANTTDLASNPDVKKIRLGSGNIDVNFTILKRYAASAEVDLFMQHNVPSFTTVPFMFEGDIKIKMISI